MIICEWCHIKGRERQANYAIRVDVKEKRLKKLDWYLCYDCSEEARINYDGKISKTIKGVFWPSRDFMKSFED